MHEEFISQARTAYFSMEIALRADIPTYSGGLGVLAGDALRSAADLDLYAAREKWIAVMKGAICKNASFFNSHRMMRRYVMEAYRH